METLEQREKRSGPRAFVHPLLEPPSQRVGPRWLGQALCPHSKESSKERPSASHERRARGAWRAPFFLTEARGVSGTQTLVSLAILPLAGLSLPGDMTQCGVQCCPLPGAEGRVPGAFLHSVRCLAWGLTLKLTEAPSVCGGNSGKVQRGAEKRGEGIHAVGRAAREHAVGLKPRHESASCGPGHPGRAGWMEASSPDSGRPQNPFWST